MLTSISQRIVSTFSKQYQLFTPGPLVCSNEVKSSMLIDYGSRDPMFMTYIKEVRDKLVKLTDSDPAKYTSVLLQGSGTYGVEATLQANFPKNNSSSQYLIVANGAYGERMAKIAEYYNIKHKVLRYQDDQVIRAEDLEAELKKEKFSHLALIHSETTSGLINPIEKLGKVFKSINPNGTYIVDAMSSFGAYHIPIQKWGIDYLVSSSNKCLQGVPGFTFAISNIEKLKETKGQSKSLVLDLYDQWENMEKSGQFRFTPPTHAIRAFHAALVEHERQGGTQGRFNKYNEMQKHLVQEMQKLGFKLYIDQSIQGCIITTFLTPKNKEFNFQELYQFLADRGQLIYPGKLTKADSFRIGSIGGLSLDNMKSLLSNIKEYINKKQIDIKY